jgi:glutamyl-tRNA reductase
MSRAESIAQTVNARAVGLGEIRSMLAQVDAVVCAAGTQQWLVTLDDLLAAVRADRSLIVVDLAMPSAVEPGDLEGVTRIDLAGLEDRVERHRRQREAEIPRVESVIARELQWLHAWARHQTLRPLVSGLRRKAEAIRRSELARAERELTDAGGLDTAVLDRLSRRLLDQILAIPLAQLEAGDLPLDTTHAEYLRRLFALTDTTNDEAAGS